MQDLTSSPHQHDATADAEESDRMPATIPSVTPEQIVTPPPERPFHKSGRS